MHRTIELGRAVLSTSTVNFELWLRTLITISPQQQRTDLEQSDATSVLEFLSTGEVWVGRGNGLHIDLNLTLRGQPLAHEQLQQLSEDILEAPAWAQLSLKPSTPDHAVQEPGTIRIMVNYSPDSAIPVAKQYHRVLSSTSAADVRPPEGVTIFYLDKVVFVMDIVELIPRRNTVTAKRLKTSTISNIMSQSNDRQEAEDINGTSMDDNHSHLTNSSLGSLPVLKRPRAPFASTVRTAVSPTPPNENIVEELLGSQTSEVHVQAKTPCAGNESSSMRALIDGALRLSILSSINSKMIPGIKTKANTFSVGLADLAPALWKPGYLSALSQRANLLPTISRSLSQPGITSKITSTSLERKLSALATPSLQPQIWTQDQGYAHATHRARLISSSARQLWLHLQKHTPCKPTSSLQSFISSPPPSGPLLDDILEEPRQGLGGDRSYWPITAGMYGTPGVDQGLEICCVDTAACNALPPETRDLGPVPIPRFILDEDELLLGDERIEDANPLAFRGSEVS